MEVGLRCEERRGRREGSGGAAVAFFSSFFSIGLGRRLKTNLCLLFFFFLFSAERASQLDCGLGQRNGQERNVHNHCVSITCTALVSFFFLFTKGM